MRYQTISVLTVAKIIEAAAVAGLDPGSLWPIVGGARELTLERRVLAGDHYALWTTILRRLRRPGFPIEYAAKINVDDYDVLGFAVKTADDLGAAVERTVRYHHLWTDSSRWQLRRGSGVLEMVFVRDGARDLGMRCANEAALGETTAIARQLGGSAMRPLRVRFRHPAPPDLRAHREHFDAPLEFDAERDSVEFAADLLAQPLARRDPAMSKFFVGQLEQRAGGEKPLRLALEALIREALPSGPPGIEDVARRLGMSARTLQRRLAEQDTSFLDVLEDTRRSLAAQLVAEPGRPLAEVAFLLGFAELRGFYRAFRRWTGETPAAYRAAARPPNAGDRA